MKITEQQERQIRSDLKSQIGTLEERGVRELSDYEIDMIMAIIRINLGDNPSVSENT